eukprot:gb/GEZN01020849.1/.p1 GENE.gb/GEZN01020849.1/~~gb/GEZN01020849.1/.p1  ORF type:complete len:151 (+),score=32.83 gb/GEZN01020849.1/:185-637(+)
MAEPELGDKDKEPEEDKDTKDMVDDFDQLSISSNSPTRAQISMSGGTLKAGLSLTNTGFKVKVFNQRNIPVEAGSVIVEAKLVSLKVKKMDGYYLAKQGGEYLLFKTFANVKTHYGSDKPEWAVSAELVGNANATEWLVNGKVVVQKKKK